MFPRPTSLLRPRLLRLAAALATAAVLAGCGGSDIVDRFQPQRIVSLGDEYSYIAAAGDAGITPDLVGRKHAVNVLRDDGSTDCNANRLWNQQFVEGYGFSFAQCNPNGRDPSRALLYARPGATAAGGGEASIAAQIGRHAAQAGGFRAGDLVLVFAGANDVEAAYRRVRGDAPPGPVLMIGAGGVGKAVAFGLVALGLTEIRIADRDLPKAQALSQALAAARPGLVTSTGTDAAALAPGASGIINCTPVGMAGYDGTPLPRDAMAGGAWVFDAVYTPVETRFLQDAGAEGLQVISGYELFFGQGVDAWRIFTGLPLDEARMRRELAEGKDVA